jgi:hypothetical protein
MTADSDNLQVIEIEGYLTESKLAKALQALLPEGWLGNQVPVAGRRAVGYGVRNRRGDHGGRI